MEGGGEGDEQEEDPYFGEGGDIGYLPADHVNNINFI